MKIKFFRGNLRQRISLLLLAHVIFNALVLDSVETRAQATLPYKNPQLPVDERVKDLLGRMTLEEKAAQLMCLWNAKPQAIDAKNSPPRTDRGDFSPEKAKTLIPNGIGQIARQGEDKTPVGSAEFANA